MSRACNAQGTEPLRQLVCLDQFCWFGETNHCLLLSQAPAVPHPPILPLSLRFHPAGAPNCCTCVKAAGNNNNAAAAGKDTAGDGNNTDNTNSTDASGYDNKSGDSGNAESSTKAGDGGNDSSSDDGDSKGGKGGKGDDKKDGGEGKKKDSEDRKSHNERRNATAQEKPATPNGVYLFAQTFVTNFTEEQVRQRRAGLVWCGLVSIVRAGWGGRQWSKDACLK